MTSRTSELSEDYYTCTPKFLLLWYSDSTNQGVIMSLLIKKKIKNMIAYTSSISMKINKFMFIWQIYSSNRFKVRGTCVKNSTRRVLTLTPPKLGMMAHSVTIF